MLGSNLVDKIKDSASYRESARILAHVKNSIYIAGALTFLGSVAACSQSPTRPDTNFIPITACTEITSPGSYVLQNDLVGDNVVPCLNVHNTKQVYIECAGKTISSNTTKTAMTGIVSIIHVDDFSLRNCGIQAFGKPNYVKVDSSSNGLVTGNGFINSTYQQFFTTRTSFEGNALEWRLEEVMAELINLLGGSENRVMNNSGDGNGSVDPVTSADRGLDDGINLQGESGDTVSKNTLKNFYTCGIETLGVSNNNTITYNRISNAVVGAICGWYGFSMQHTNISYNIADSVGQLVRFERALGLADNERHVYWQNNNFDFNVITHPINTGSFAFIRVVGSSTNDIPDSLFVRENNRFTGNDFGPGPGPYIAPASSVVDGGGNKCGSPNPAQTPNPLVCN